MDAKNSYPLGPRIAITLIIILLIFGGSYALKQGLERTHTPPQEASTTTIITRLGTTTIFGDSPGGFGTTTTNN
ncbi:MAG: hypothetical protein COV10_01115 [Candidatus Vogelbacteria bacterium CG10_big_fil_rev_8_21_14_0_10_51_16]|uniref:Uncharacterized protein n=1 Tax=Candidatus Vogelbacteria bacterium CG10_big_fil_rev_8_21_14_0_10_51_16 TaxID=1975045 RepID=A0A2H0RF26_9BACT|nr:MAG: hypothetical protein COV10_01115 [Candidatus Vogelbacteria bacterium CG10_big_fil_rev_8_21_14_0_10_51_16]